MKKNILFLLLIPFFFACSSDDNEADNVEPTQDYTSFVFVHNEPVILSNSVVGYLTSEGNYKLVATLGDLKQGVESKEIKIQDDNIKELYLFSDYPDVATKSDAVFRVKTNIRNLFKIDKYTKGIKVDKNDSKQYPQ